MPLCPSPLSARWPKVTTPALALTFVLASACAGSGGSSTVPATAGAADALRACMRHCEAPRGSNQCERYSVAVPEVCNVFLVDGDHDYRHQQQDYVLSQYGPCMATCDKTVDEGYFCGSFPDDAVEICTFAYRAP